jgi:hypothetical protein
VYIVEKEKSIKLHSAELAALWGSSLNDSMSACVLKYFKEKNEDSDFAPVIDYALQLCQKHVQTIREIFTNDNIPVPIGFKDDDVSIEAPRLFSDPYHLYYINNMTKVGMSFYGFALAQSTRNDVKEFYSECMQSTVELYNKVADVLLTKGLYLKPPLISYPDKVDFVTKQSFVGGLIGEKRALTAIEISHLTANIQTNLSGHALLLGFSQMMKDTNLRNYMIRGVEIAKKHLEVFTSALQKEDIIAPMPWAQNVEDSTISPFSDKLMLYHATYLSTLSIGTYGVALGNSPRKDIAINYVRLIEEIAEFANDGANIMIDNKWLEKPPQANNRKVLMKS